MSDSNVILINPGATGFKVLYHENQVNHCPCCHRSHWYVGRFSAECAFCETALPLASTAMVGTGTHSRNRREIPLAA